MDTNLKAKWVEALRSEKFKQGSGWLENDGKYCCLGVLCSIQEPEWKSFWNDAEDSLYTEILPSDLDADLTREDCRELANMNDNGKSFAEIADYIEANL